MIVTGVRDLVQRIDDGRTNLILGDQMIGMLDDTVCDLHRVCGDEERVFLD
jgi:hypothetical protein